MTNVPSTASMSATTGAEPPSPPPLRARSSERESEKKTWTEMEGGRGMEGEMERKVRGGGDIHHGV